MTCNVVVVHFALPLCTKIAVICAPYLRDRKQASYIAQTFRMLCSTVEGGEQVGYFTRAPPVPVCALTLYNNLHSAAMSILTVHTACAHRTGECT